MTDPANHLQLQHRTKQRSLSSGFQSVPTKDHIVNNLEGREVRLTGDAGSSGAAAWRTDQHLRGEITVLSISGSGPQLALSAHSWLLAWATGCIAVPKLDGGGHRGCSGGQ